MKRQSLYASEKDEINAKKKLTSKQKNSILNLSIYKLKLSIYKLRLSLYIRSLRIENYIRKHDFLFANFMTISANVHWVTLIIFMSAPNSESMEVAERSFTPGIVWRFSNSFGIDQLKAFYIAKNAPNGMLVNTGDFHGAPPNFMSKKKLVQFF